VIAGGNMSISVNALRLTNGTLDLASAGRMLYHGSGNLLVTGTSSITNGTLQFGTGEGIITVMSATSTTINPPTSPLAA